MKFICKILLGLIMVLLGLLALTPLAFPAERATNDQEVYNSCCRVYSGSYAGSGTAFSENGGYIYILTNFHVCQNNDAKVQFFAVGEACPEIPAENVARGYNEEKSIDFVILRVKSSGYVKNFVPFWKAADGNRLEEKTAIIGTTGCPRAQYLRTIRGKIAGYNQNNNIVFSPTPYGGQSGSSIVIYNNDLPYIAGLLTWRTAEEGKETSGGLAQPISRVINCLEQNAAGVDMLETGENKKTLEYNLNTPKETQESQSGKVIEHNGEYKIECAVALPVLEVWSLPSGCQPCQQLAADIQAGEFGAVKIVKHGQSAAVRSYPYIRIKTPDGVVLRSFIGYDQATKEEIKRTIEPYQAAAVEAETPEYLETMAGKLPFSIPFTDQEEGKKPEPQKQEQPQKKEQPADNSKLFNLLFGNLRAELQEQLLELTGGLEAWLNGKIKALFLPLFFFVAAACIFANIATRTALVFIRFAWRKIKEVFSVIAAFIFNRFNYLDEKIIKKLAEEIEKINIKKE